MSAEGGAALDGIAPRYFAHVNLNTPDLDRALGFYRDRLGLGIGWRTEPDVAQDGALFGMAGTPVAWRGALLVGPQGGRGPMLDLLQWTRPATAVVGGVAAARLGLSRLVVGVPSEALVAEGALVVDPDGCEVELVAADASVLLGVVLVCSSLPRSEAFYRDAMGFEVEGDARGARVHLPGGRDRFSIFLREADGPLEPPSSDATAAGLFRIAILVDAIDPRRLPPGAGPLCDAELGDELGLVRAVLLPDPDGVTLEYVEPLASVSA
ncbi:MAG TPA: VOC family protein [Baekduia sp.]|jgi:catechol 2,3-dioxygenase-like lactoylglutathione lyase family enzyme